MLDPFLNATTIETIIEQQQLIGITLELTSTLLRNTFMIYESSNERKVLLAFYEQWLFIKHFIVATLSVYAILNVQKIF